MTKKNPEISENMETPETKHELKNLELNILSNSKDRKNFEALSKDPVLKKWLNKILKKGLDYNFESIKDLDVYIISYCKRNCALALRIPSRAEE